MRKNNYGREYELVICSYLENKGMKILGRNYTVSGGEIDVIASDGKYICFVEVKFRSERATDAYSSVGYKKQHRIIKAAQRYLAETGCKLQPRFDVAFVFSCGGVAEIEYMENAYDASSY
ncbi:MAG: YraN family protein [Porcipelethomonas sp.]